MFWMEAFYFRVHGSSLLYHKPSSSSLRKSIPSLSDLINHVWKPVKDFFLAPCSNSPLSFCTVMWLKETSVWLLQEKVQGSLFPKHWPFHFILFYWNLFYVCMCMWLCLCVWCVRRQRRNKKRVVGYSGAQVTGAMTWAAWCITGSQTWDFCKSSKH